MTSGGWIQISSCKPLSYAGITRFRCKGFPLCVSQQSDLSSKELPQGLVGLLQYCNRSAMSIGTTGEPPYFCPLQGPLLHPPIALPQPTIPFIMSQPPIFRPHSPSHLSTGRPLLLRISMIFA